MVSSSPLISLVLSLPLSAGYSCVSSPCSSTVHHRHRLTPSSGALALMLDTSLPRWRGRNWPRVPLKLIRRYGKTLRGEETTERSSLPINNGVGRHRPHRWSFSSCLASKPSRDSRSVLSDEGDDDDGDDDDEYTDGRTAAIDGLTTLQQVARVNREEDADEEEFLRRELAHLDSLEEILAELEDASFLLGDESDDDDAEEEDPVLLLNELLESIGESEEEDDDDDVEEHEESEGASVTAADRLAQSSSSSSASRMPTGPFSALESALMQGVVPVGAGVGDDSLPGDFGFDPLHLSKRDFFRPAQSVLLRMLPGGGSYSGFDGSPTVDESPSNATATLEGQRPPALILRDYREAEIRHGRLAMLAAVVWPLQEMLDRLVLEDDLYGPLLYGPVTLPYLPLFMTAVLLLLGYLDIYAAAIKEMDDIGDAYLPGDCFWDPLRILIGTSPDTKRRMQERELLNGRAAMLAFAVFVWEELVTHTPVIDIPGNELLFQPLYQVPLVQAWLDTQFSATTSALLADPDALYVPLE